MCSLSAQDDALGGSIQANKALGSEEAGDVQKPVVGVSRGGSNAREGQNVQVWDPFPSGRAMRTPGGPLGKRGGHTVWVMGRFGEGLRQAWLDLAGAAQKHCAVKGVKCPSQRTTRPAVLRLEHKPGR